MAIGTSYAVYAGAGDDWPTIGGDYENTRYSHLTDITADNVGELEVKWEFHTGSVNPPANSGFYVTPLVIDGVMYVSDPGLFGVKEQGVFAVDAVTGEEIWHTVLPLESSRDNEFLVWRPHKGVAFGNGRVFMATFDARLWALDAATGAPVTSFTDGTFQDGSIMVGHDGAGYYLTAAPIFVPSEMVPPGGPASGHDIVLIGISGGDNATRGYFSAFDADTGELLWRFFTVPASDEFGGDTWVNTGDNAFDNPFDRGGAAPWMHPAVDPETGMIYFGTGNAGPDLDGTHRAGDNLFAVSIIALNSATGERAWHFQEVHHDLWDMDQSSSPLLFDVEVRRGLGVKDDDDKVTNKRTIKAVGAAGKTGWYYILDRATGRPIHPCPETPVANNYTVVVAPDGSPELPSPKQPMCMSDAFVPQGDRYTPSGQYVQPIFTPPGLPRAGNNYPAFSIYNEGVFEPDQSDVVLEPSIIGGNEWSPPAHDPVRGMTFIPGNIAPYRLTSLPEEFPDQQFGPNTFNGAGYWSPGTLETVLSDQSGNLSGFRVRTGKIEWQAETDSTLLNGVCATAGGIVIMGEGVLQNGVGPMTWYVTAFSSSNGSRLWSWEVPGNVAVNAPCISYSVDDKQYIAIAIGGSRNSIGNSGDAIYVFGLPDGFDE
jgi:glucose dehydrogenase